MPTEILAPGTTAAVSSDVVVTTVNKTVSLYRAEDDALLLENNFRLLTEAGDAILLEEQAGDTVSFYDKFPIYIKDPLGGYNPTGLVLRSFKPFAELGPGTWQVVRPEVSTAIGVQVD